MCRRCSRGCSSLASQASCRFRARRMPRGLNEPLTAQFRGRVLTRSKEHSTGADGVSSPTWLHNRGPLLRPHISLAFMGRQHRRPPGYMSSATMQLQRRGPHRRSLSGTSAMATTAPAPESAVHRACAGNALDHQPRIYHTRLVHDLVSVSIAKGRRGCSP